MSINVKVDVYFQVYFAETFIVQNFGTLADALAFALQHRRTCEEHRDSPVKIKKVKVTTESDFVYDDIKGLLPWS